jgi:hypothetical protein
MPPDLRFGIQYGGGPLRDSYLRARVLAVRPGERSWQWQFVSPPNPGGPGSQPWPLIPSDVHPYNRQDGDVWTVPEATVAYVPGGYDTIRASAFSIPSPRVLIAGVYGRLVFQDIPQP